MFQKYAKVVVDRALNKTLCYGIPDECLAEIRVGLRVEVPLGSKSTEGYVLDIVDQPDFFPIKPISKIISSEEWLQPELLKLANWMTKYYCTPLQKVLKIIVPSTVRNQKKVKQQLFVMRTKTKEELKEICISLRKSSPAQANVLDVMLNVKKGILLTELLEKTGGTRSPVDTLAKKGFISLDIVRIDRSPLENEEYIKTKSKKLSHDQQTALNAISTCLDTKQYETFLLHGITGSGKTEVYLQAIDKALNQDKGSIILVPEIALTTQTIERFRSRYHQHIAILHHRVSEGERNEEWHKIRKGETKIVIGARSALFCPMPNLGLIIVDEEHDSSYKQTDEMPCYNARDVAVMRGKMSGATVLLGSATPSLESFHNAQQAKYKLLTLRHRAESASLPKMTIVNMKREYEKTKGYTNFSEQLLEGIKKRQSLGEQSILFLNRRGYFTTLLCQQCQHTVKCAHCDLAMTFHLNENILSCHLCGFSLTPPRNCPCCRSENPLKYKGIGTEQLEKALHAVLPDVRTMRIDADTTRHKGSHQKLYRAFATGKADVLIGTQMVAKGLHFPQVTLVGIINCDSGLNIPDFRASENVFQLITQVAGRAGRGEIAGEVLIQTSLPENSTICMASQQDFERFYQEEMGIRTLFNFPPAAQMVKLVFSGKYSDKVFAFAKETKDFFQNYLPGTFQITQPIPAGYAKVKDKYRFHFFVRGPNLGIFGKAFELFQNKVKVPSTIQMKVDIHPLSTFW